MARTLDDTAEHLIRALRFGGRVANLVTEAVLGGRDDIAEKILARANAGATQAELTALVTREVKALDKTIKGILIFQGLIAATAEAEGAAAYLAVLGADLPKEFHPSEAYIHRVFKRPLELQNVSVDDLMKGSMAHMQRSMVNVTRTAIVEGQTLRTVSAIIEKSAGTLDDGALRRKADALARTAIASVVQDTRRRGYEVEPQVIGLIYQATLDHRTTPQCMVLDGKYFSRDDDVRTPPLHVNCRSTLIPVLEGETPEQVMEQLRRPAVVPKSIEQLKRQGLYTRRVLPDGRISRRVRYPSRTDRSPLKGTQVKYQTYEQWLKKQSQMYQKLILGKGAYLRFKQTGSLATALGVAA